MANADSQATAESTDPDAEQASTGRRRWLRWGAIGGGGLTGCLLLGGALWTIFTEPPAPEVQSRRVLESLDAGEPMEARRLAIQLGSSREVTATELGVATFAIGSSLISEAENEWDPNRRRAIFMIAARYFQEAAAKGMPPGREAEGFYRLGLSLYEAGLMTQSLPALKRSLGLTDEPRKRQRLHRMLADVYLHDPELDRVVGLEYSQLYLSSPELTESERIQGELQRTDLLMALERDAEAEAELTRLLESIPPESPLLLETHLRIGELWMERDKKWRYQAEILEDTELRRQANDALRRAIEHLEIASRSETRGGIAKYLLGVADQRLGDLPAAADRYGAVRREFVDSPLSIPAAIGEADVLQASGQFDLAFQRYVQLIELANTLNYKDANVEWLTPREFDDRLMEAQTAFRRAGRFGLALELARHMWPPVSRDVAMQLQADTYAEWGRALAGESDSAVVLDEEGQPVAADPAESRRMYREAALAYFKLSKLRRASREYLDYLWNAAEHYFWGRDYTKAIELYQRYLDEPPESRQARAYLRIGESLLAMGRPDSALEALQQCIAFYPNDSDALQARLIASQVMMARNNPVEAKRLLLYNIEESSLEPESKIWRDSLFALGRTVYNEALALEIESRKLGVDSEDARKIEEGLAKLEEARRLFEETAVWLAEAVTRYEGDPDAIEARYLLAEAYRQAAKYPQKRVKTVTINGLRFQLEQQINEELSRAFQQYDNLEEALSRTQDERELNEVERRILRNCAFAKADVLFDQKRYPEAIAAYETVSNRYANRPEALEAFCRIATCYRILNRPDMARDKIAQAELFLQDRIPQNADFEATTRYSRDEWVNYLEWLQTL